MSTNDSALAQHLPAVRVGGRRLSMPNRPKPNMHRFTPSPQRNCAEDAVEDNDYPRPHAPGEGQHEHEYGVYEDAEKHERRHAPNMRESLLHKADGNTPKLAYSASGKPQGRISQPQGKVLG